MLFNTNLFTIGNTIDAVESCLNHELRLVNLWFQANLLSLNVFKTTFMIFGRKNLSANIMIDNVSLLKQDESKFLGVILSTDKMSVAQTDMAQTHSNHN